MLSRRFARAALFIGSVLAGQPLYASDITIGPRAYIADGMQTGVQNKKAGQSTSEKKIAPHRRTRARKIFIYSLFNEPLLKPGFNAASQAQSDAASIMKKAGVGFGGFMQGATISDPQKSIFTISENTDMAFDCREKSLNPLQRELTACYVHRVDKTWKARTYVTKGLVDNIPVWRGGLSVDYVY